MLYESIKRDKSATGVQVIPLDSLIRCGVHVRRLLLYDSGSGGGRNDTQTSLSRCPNITDLALWNTEVDETLLPLIERLPLQRLSLRLTAMFGKHERFLKYMAEGPSQPLAFSQLTHLDVIGHIHIYGADIWNFLAQFPCLSYLSVSDLTSTTIQHMSRLPRLKMLLVVDEDIQNRPVVVLPKKDENDARIVSCSVDHYVKDWVRGGRLYRGTNSWEVGEQTVLARLRRNTPDP